MRQPAPPRNRAAHGPFDPERLLERGEFHRQCMAMAGGKCRLCSEPACDAHHIFERKLFADGGYRLRNACALCSDCHWAAETGKASLADVASKALGPYGWEPLWPACALAMGLLDASRWDKWGNLLRPDGSIAPGPLFHDAGCQGALAAGGRLALCYHGGESILGAQPNHPSGSTA